MVLLPTRGGDTGVEILLARPNLQVARPYIGPDVTTACYGNEKYNPDKRENIAGTGECRLAYGDYCLEGYVTRNNGITTMPCSRPPADSVDSRMEYVR